LAEEGVNFLPNLKTLVIELQNEDNTWVDPIPFFQRLEVPALTCLRLALNGADFGYLLPSFKDLTHRSKFALEILTLELPTEISEKALVKLLATLPTLTMFTLKSDINQRLLSNLTISMLDPTSGRPITECLPNLRRLNYTGCVSFTPDKLITMVKNRGKFAGVERIDNIDIKYYNKDWAQEDPNVMREFYRQLDAQEGISTGVDIIWTNDL